MIYNKIKIDLNIHLLLNGALFSKTASALAFCIMSNYLSSTSKPSFGICLSNKPIKIPYIKSLISNAAVFNSIDFRTKSFTIVVEGFKFKSKFYI